MAKYRLTWRGSGALDLSQVTDDSGLPILFVKPGDHVLVNAGTFRHPLVQNYVNRGIDVEELGVVTAPPAPPPVVIPPVITPKPEPVPEPVTPVVVPPLPPAPPPEVVPDVAPPSPAPSPVLEEPAPDSVTVVEPSPTVATNVSDKGRSGRNQRGRNR